VRVSVDDSILNMVVVVHVKKKQSQKVVEKLNKIEFLGSLEKIMRKLGMKTNTLRLEKKQSCLSANK
jgi:hypothetical protein